MARRTLTLPARAIKTLQVQDATAPAAPRYAAGKPATPPELQTAPRASDGMSTGETGGNFKQPPIAVGAGFPQVGVDAEDK